MEPWHICNIISATFLLSERNLTHMGIDGLVFYALNLGRGYALPLMDQFLPTLSIAEYSVIIFFRSRRL